MAGSSPAMTEQTKLQNHVLPGLDQAMTKQTELQNHIMPGLDPGIQVSGADAKQRPGWPDQARP